MLAGVRQILSAASGLLFVLLPLVAAAADNEVRITSDSLVHEKAASIIRAAGDVRIDWGDYTLLGDRASYDYSESMARASGTVKLLRPDDQLDCDDIWIYLPNSQGTAVNARLRTKEGNLRVNGALLVKQGETEYHLERGNFTTCDAEPPSWKFTATDLDVTVEGFATGRDAVFSIADIPVFYTPYIIFPAKRERQTGFLFPSFGNSTKKGVFANIPFYWAISPSAEATFELDLQSRRGVGLAVDSAWLRSSGSHGKVLLNTVYDTDSSRERARLNASVKEVLTPFADANADISLVSDRSFYRDYGEASGVYNRQSLDSSVSLTRRWDEWYMAAEARFLNGIDETSDKNALQRLPELTLTAPGSRLGSLPFYAALASRATNFSQRNGSSGQRLIFQPTLSWNAALADGLAFSAWGGYQQRLYEAQSGPSQDSRGIGLLMAGARASAGLAKVYSLALGDLVGLRHLLEPALEYSYVESRGQGQLPFFDYDDRVIGGSMLSWMLTSRLTGRFESVGSPEYRELLKVRLSQGYQLDGGRRDLLNPADEGRRFTDIRLEVVAELFKSLSIDVDSRFSVYRPEVTTAAVTADLHDSQGNSAGIGFRRIEGTVDYLAGNLALSLVKPFVFNYSGRYSFDKSGFLESYYALEYRHQCWSIALSYRDRPDNREYLVSFNLAGIGNIGKVKPF
jgi:LPS-assembly protein